MKEVRLQVRSARLIQAQESRHLAQVVEAKEPFFVPLRVHCSHPRQSRSTAAHSFLGVLSQGGFDLF
jgi:hypothetical protein